MAPVFPRDALPEDHQWSKEALFGLLGVLAVVFVPCIGLLIRCSYLRWRQAQRQNLLLPALHQSHPGAPLVDARDGGSDELGARIEL
ncbi:hypothetical protein BKA63DRAFT_562278 [Paraphoma chrysanthemicola]|nr:hypothetical protein BKA63DRAFT_562278 [Paraphoma chrysanthemicola]